MFSKKFLLLATALLVLAGIPALASAAPMRIPTHDRIAAGDTQVTGLSADKLTITLTFPDGASVSTVAAGNNARWTVPASGTLQEGDKITFVWTNGVDTGQHIITVESAGTSLDGSTNNGNSGTNAGSTDNGSSTAVSSNTTANNTTAATSTETTTADNGTGSIPKTGEVMPMVYLTVGLFVVGLALALLMRAAYLRRQA